MLLEPCNWGIRTPCRAQNAGCACPAPRIGVAGSSVPEMLSGSDGVLIVWAYILLFSMPLVIAIWRRATTSWCTCTLHEAGLAQVPRGWLAVSAALTGAAWLANVVLPADLWRECSLCVYHAMFCEATRSDAVRHPANFWSNMIYLHVSVYLLLQAAGDMAGRCQRRAYALLDGCFGGFLFAMCLASLSWHASGCTVVHFVDIGLMNAVIVYLPVRCAAMALASLLRSSDERLSIAAALCYATACALIMRDALLQAPNYHQGFPTGRDRSWSSQRHFAVEGALFVAAPALYPLPAIAVAALRKTWGHVPSMYIALLSLAVGFGVDTTERFVLDLFCRPTSWLQPTAILHVATGVTIGAGYTWARSMQALSCNERLHAE